MNLNLNLKNVCMGDVFSTESKMFRQLGLEVPKAGKALSLMRDMVKEWIDWEKTGRVSRGKVTNEIRITHIRDEPIKKEDKRINNGANKYIDDLVPLLHEYISRVGEIQTTTKKFIEYVGLSKKNYSNMLIYQKGNVVKQTVLLFDSYGQVGESQTKIANKVLGDFIYFADDIIKRSVRTALNKLSKQGKIEYIDKIVYCISDENNEPHKADEYEINIIQSVETDILGILYKDGKIKEPLKKYTRLGKINIEFNNLVNTELNANGIYACWQELYVKCTEKYSIPMEERQELLNSIRKKYVDGIMEMASKKKYGYEWKKKWFGTSDNKFVYAKEHNTKHYFYMMQFASDLVGANIDVKAEYDTYLETLNEFHQEYIKNDLNNEDNIPF